MAHFLCGQGRVREIFTSLDKEGCWMTRGRIQKRSREFNNRIKIEEFIKSTAALAACLDAVK